MDTQEIANKVVALCQTQKNLEAIQQFYDKDIVSIESMAAPGSPAESKGIDAVKGKNQGWMESTTVHKGEARGPYVMGDRFAIQFSYDITSKKDGKRTQMDEIGLYQVRNGKIVREEFFTGKVS